MDNNYNNYNSNNVSYEDGANNEEEVTTYEDDEVTNTTQEDCANYTENPPDNYKQETADNNAVDEIPVMGATEEIAILNAIDNDISVITRDTTVDM